MHAYLLVCRLEAGVKTPDIGGSASTSQFVGSVIDRLSSDGAAAKAAKKSKGVSKAV